MLTKFSPSVNLNSAVLALWITVLRFTEEKLSENRNYLFIVGSRKETHKSDTGEIDT